MTRVLIANRGEIAVRIMRSCRELGFTSIALFSEADQHSPHVRCADAAYPLKGIQSQESYLDPDQVIAAVKQSKADLLHPGYGFLSENAAFARRLQAETACRWVGPSPEVIDMMGDKITARRQAKSSGLPLLEGSQALASPAKAKQYMKEVGFPLLIKASSGGGGKGMRRVAEEKDFDGALAMAQSEAENAFGDKRVYLEKYLSSPRHVEVQVFGCSDGRILVLGTRDCSIQRRHQKIIEEAPAPFLSAETEAKLAQAAKKLSQDVGYQGAGTLEFLLDAQEHFYFLEMNTRLQVEHPVTESIYGLDLVAWQLKTALKEDAELKAPQARGHAVEARIYAEDPEQNFLPSPGHISQIRWPLIPNLRIDSGVESGQDIGVYYDPLLAKLIAWAPNRSAAIKKLQSALRELRIQGSLGTNQDFLRRLCQEQRFLAGKISTHYLDEAMPPKDTPLSATLIAMASSALISSAPSPDTESESKARPSPSLWWQSGRS